LLLPLIAFFLCVSIRLNALPEEIQKHYALKDYSSCKNLAKECVFKNPQDKLAWQYYIYSLANLGEEKDAHTTYQTFCTYYPEEALNHPILETLSWSVLRKYSHSSYPKLRFFSLMGAAFCQDVSGVKIVEHMLDDTTDALRAVAVKAAASYRDEKLKKKLLMMCEKDSSQEVRCLCVEALGALEVKEALPHLMHILNEEHVNPELMLAAVKALVHLYDPIEVKDAQKLLLSTRAGLRELGARLMAFQNMDKDCEILYPLLNDPHPVVRIAAVETLTFLKKKIPENLLPTQKDQNLALLLDWHYALFTPNLTKDLLSKHIYSNDMALRRHAASLIANSHLAASSFASDVMIHTKDPFIALSLARGQITHRKEIFKAAEVVHQKLEEIQEPISFLDSIFASEVVPFAQLKKMMPASERKKEDLLTRLQLIRMLAIIKYEKTDDLLKRFLKEKSFVGSAISLSLQEMGEDMGVSLDHLLEDEDKKIQLQAACILASFGEKEKACDKLLELYKECDREKKLSILEAIASLQDKRCLPFLVQELHASHPTLRILAAAAILKTLYA
jgi:HEAT repeat protein